MDKDVPQAITIQKCFKDAGYTTISNGKIFYHDDEASRQYWDEILPPKDTTPWGYHSENNQQQMERYAADRKAGRGLFYEHSNTPESEFLDWKIADKSVRDLRRRKDSDKPFFLAVGFIRPHLPFIVPQEYWDLYDNDHITLPDNFILKKDTISRHNHSITGLNFDNTQEFLKKVNWMKQQQKT